MSARNLIQLPKVLFNLMYAINADLRAQITSQLIAYASLPSASSYLYDGRSFCRANKLADESLNKVFAAMNGLKWSVEKVSKVLKFASQLHFVEHFLPRARYH